MKVALLVSGNLGFELFKLLEKEVDLAAVLTDMGSETISSFAQEKSIPCFSGNPRNGKAVKFIQGIEVDLLLSINYLFLVEEDIINWPTMAAVNFHGSLLPKYRGRTPHVWAIINNERKTGVTAHFVTKGCDEGDIVLQKEVLIGDADTGADILDKFCRIYPEIVLEVVDKAKKTGLHGVPQNNELATYFGKRTPEDGKINWNWQRERIRNWVRAQAFPYPGAFSYIDDQKITIDSVEFDEFGFNQTEENGKILTLDPIRVKTPNGVLKLTKVRGSIEHIEMNTILK